MKYLRMSVIYWVTSGQGMTSDDIASIAKQSLNDRQSKLLKLAVWLGFAPLAWLALRNEWGAVMHLLEVGWTRLDRSRQGASALDVAVRRERHDVVRALCEAINKGKVLCSESDLASALIHAVQTCSEEDITSLLATGAPISAVEGLHEAALFRVPGRVLRVLVSGGARLPKPVRDLLEKGHAVGDSATPQ
jgi:hypothetical protein